VPDRSPFSNQRMSTGRAKPLDGFRLGGGVPGNQRMPTGRARALDVFRLGGGVSELSPFSNRRFNGDQ